MLGISILWCRNRAGDASVILGCFQNMIWHRNGALMTMAVKPAKNNAHSMDGSSCGFVLLSITCLKAPNTVAILSTKIPKLKRIIPKLKFNTREIRVANISKPSAKIIILVMNFFLFLSFMFSMTSTNTLPGSYRCPLPVLQIFPQHPSAPEY